MKLSELVMMGILAFAAGAVVVKTLGLDEREYERNTRTERQEANIETDSDNPYP